MKTLRIFISSPSDVLKERVRADDVISRLQTKFRAYIRLEAIRWEHEPMEATATFQDQIVPPSQTDIVVCILWGKIGMRLPRGYSRPDGSVPTGTEWEFEDAYAAFLKTKGTPKLLVYRKVAEHEIKRIKDDRQVEQWLAQKKALDVFLTHWFKDHEGAFKAAFNTFGTDDQFEQMLTDHLERIIGKIVNEAASEKIVWTSGSPFRGLQAFQPEHEVIFCGRSLAISEVISRLTRQAAQGPVFLLILGMSGCGKSSLVRAGILPELQRAGVFPAVGCWRWALFRPSDSPGTLIEGLAAALFEDKKALPELAQLGYTPRRLADLLRDAPIYAIEPVQTALEKIARDFAEKALRAEPRPAKLVLVIDQLEELFTDASIDDRQRQAFFAALSALSHSKLVWVVATMRSDFYFRCAEIEKLRDLKGSEGQYDLLPPTVSEINQMIQVPAFAAGLRYEIDPKTGQSLDQVLLQEASSNPEALPLLEYCLDELYLLRDGTKLTRQAYASLGGLKGAISLRAEKVYQKLSPEAQQALPKTLAALIALGQETATARRALRREFLGHPGAEEWIRAYLEANLLVSHVDSSGQATVALAHECLISNWPRVQDWLRDNQDFLRAKRRLIEAAGRWREAGRDPDYLHASGKPLAEAEELLATRKEQLGAEEIEFAAASSQLAARRREAEAKRRSRRWRLLAAALTTAVLVASLWAVLAVRARRLEAEHSSMTEFILANRLLDGGNSAEGLARLVHAARIDPGNRLVAPRLMSALTARNFLLPEGEPLKLPTPGRIHKVQFDATGDQTFVLGDDGIVRCFHSPEGRPTHEFHYTRDPSGKIRVFDRVGGRGPGPTDHVMLVTDWAFPRRASGSLRRIGGTPPRPVFAICLEEPAAPRQGPPVSAPQTLLVCDQSSGEPLTAQPPVLPNRLNPYELFAVSPNGRWFAAGSMVAIWLWDSSAGGDTRFPLQSSDGVSRRTLPGDFLSSLNFSPDSNLLVATLFQPDLFCIWKVSDHTRLFDALSCEKSDAVPPKQCHYADFSPDGKWLGIGTLHGAQLREIGHPKQAYPLEVPGHAEGRCDQVLFTPDGNKVITLSITDRTVSIWDVATHHLDARLPHGGGAYEGFLSQDGQVLLTTCGDRNLRLWSTQSRTPQSPSSFALAEPTVKLDARTPPEFMPVDLSPDGARVVVGTPDGWVLRFRLGLGAARPLVVSPRPGWVRFSARQPTQLRVISGNDLRLVDARSGKEMARPFKFHAEISDEFELSPDGRFLVAQTQSDWEADQRLRKSAQTAKQTGDSKPAPRKFLVWRWDLSGKLPDLSVSLELDLNEPLPKIVFSPIGDLFALVAAHEIRVWAVESGQPVCALRMPSQTIERQEASPVATAFYSESIQLSADSRWLAAGTTNGSGFVWELSHPETPHPLAPLPNHQINFIGFSPSGTRLVSTSTPGEVRLWDARTFLPVGPVLRHNERVDRAVFSPDGNWLASFSQDGTAIVWSVATGQMIGQPMHHGLRIQDLAFSPDGAQIVTTSNDCTARIWDARTGQPLTDPIPNGCGPTDLATVVFSSDGRLAGSRSYAKPTSIWAAPPDDGLAPEWELSLATLCAERQVNADGRLESVSNELGKFEPLRQGIASLPDHTPLTEWGRWFVSNDPQRGPAPGLTAVGTPSP